MSRTVSGGSHETVRLDCVAFKRRGTPGGIGNVVGSGLRCKCAPGCFSTVRAADHDVSPLSDEAVHVYNPESLICKSVKTM